jgi:hypothetical protein
MRKSGPQSISNRVCSVSTSAEHLNRLSFAFVLWQTSHWQPMVGTPHDVPVPNKVSFIIIVFFQLLQALWFNPFCSQCPGPACNTSCKSKQKNPNAQTFAHLFLSKRTA